MDNAFLLPPGEGGAKRRMREGERLASKFRYTLIFHSLIRPAGTFSRWEKEQLSHQRPRVQLRHFVSGTETALLIPRHLRQRALRVMSEEQMHVARQFVFQERTLLVDQ